MKGDLNKHLSMSASLFQITRGLEYVNDQDTFVRDGQARHRGLELGLNAQLGEQFVLDVSLAALDTNQSGTGKPQYDGNRVTNVAELKSTVRLDYAVTQLPGLMLSTTWRHSGDKAFDPKNTVIVPGYNVFDLGAAYNTKLGKRNLSLHAFLINATDKFYWRDVTQELGGYLFPGAPRHLKLSATVDF